MFFAHLAFSVRYICFNIFSLFIISVSSDKIVCFAFKRDVQVNVDADVDVFSFQLGNLFAFFYSFSIFRFSSCRSVS